MVEKKKRISRAGSKLIKSSDKIIKRPKFIRRRTKHLSMMKTPVPETSADSAKSTPKSKSPKIKSPKLIANSISIDHTSWQQKLAGMPLEILGKSNGPKSVSLFKRVQLPKILPKKPRIISLPKSKESPEKMRPPVVASESTISYIDVRNAKKKWLESINAKVVMEDSFMLKDLRKQLVAIESSPQP